MKVICIVNNNSMDISIPLEVIIQGNNIYYMNQFLLQENQPEPTSFEIDLRISCRPGHNQGGNLRCDYVTRSGVSRKSHTKLIFTCFLHKLGWHEEVWISIVALEKAFFLREGHIWWFYSPFHRYGVSFQIDPLIYIRQYEEMCVNHWMIPEIAHKKLISSFSYLICLYTKRIDKSICIILMTCYGKRDASVAG